MQQAIVDRLAELKEEYQKGQKKLLVLNQETTELSNTILRISGAIQVLEELLGVNAVSNSPPTSNGVEAPKP